MRPSGQAAEGKCGCKKIGQYCLEIGASDGGRQKFDELSYHGIENIGEREASG